MVETQKALSLAETITFDSRHESRNQMNRASASRKLNSALRRGWSFLEARAILHPLPLVGACLIKYGDGHRRKRALKRSAEHSKRSGSSRIRSGWANTTRSARHPSEVDVGGSEHEIRRPNAGVNSTSPTVDAEHIEAGSLVLQARHEGNSVEQQRYFLLRL